MNSLPISIHRNEYVHIVQEGETWKIEEKKLTFFEKVRVFFGFGEEYKQYQLGTVESMLANHIDVLKGDEHYAELVHKIHAEAGKSVLPVIKTAHDNIEVNQLLQLSIANIAFNRRDGLISELQDGRLRLDEELLNDWKPFVQRESFRGAYLEYVARVWETMHEGRLVTPDLLQKAAASISDEDWKRDGALKDIARIVSGGLNAFVPVKGIDREVVLENVPEHHKFSAIEGGESREPIMQIRFTAAAKEAWAKELATEGDAGRASFEKYMIEFWLHRQELLGTPIEKEAQDAIIERFHTRLADPDLVLENALDPDTTANVYNSILNQELDAQQR